MINGDIYMIYETFCYSLTTEMSQYVKYSDSSKNEQKSEALLISGIS